MERWVGKVAVVTGASSGIGAEIALDLVKAGMIVVGLARRNNRINELKKNLPISSLNNLHALKCDVSKEEDVVNAFAWVETNFGCVHVLINNAGILRTTSLVAKFNTKPIREVLDTNVMGVVFCTREAFQLMKKNSVDGHVVLINSISGHKVPYLVGQTSSLNIYPSTKFAITAMTEVLRQEFQAEATKIKITVRK